MFLPNLNPPLPSNLQDNLKSSFSLSPSAVLKSIDLEGENPNDKSST